MSRLGKDLSTVRNKLGMSLEEVHTASRIPIMVLETIEDGSIFTDLATNNTMIRSNVRSFARILKIDDQKIIEALNMYEKGTDIGFLPEEKTEVQEGEIKEEQTQEVQAPPTKQSRRRGRNNSRRKNQSNTPVKESEPAAVEQNKNIQTSENKTDEGDKETKTEIPKSELAKTEVSNSMFNQDLSDVDWERLNKRSNLKRPKQSISFVAVLIAVLVVSCGVLYFLGYFDFLFKNSEQESSEPEPSSETSNWLESDTNQEDAVDIGTLDEETVENGTDSLSVSINNISPTENVESEIASTDSPNQESDESIDNEVVPESSPVSSSENNIESSDKYRFIPSTATSLPAELEILVYAASDNLSPIRIQWDNMNTLRPYWIEFTEAMKVQFANELHLRTLDYDRIVLIFNGHPIENIEDQFYDAEKGILIIPRSYFENELSRFLEPFDNSNGFLGYGEPSRLYDRPTF